MARKIRFALDMENGVEVRTLEELKENFSLEKVLMHIASGKFDTWLRDRYYDDVADKVEALDTSDSNFNKKICEIFGVSYDNTSEADYEKAEEHNRRLSLLKAVSDEQEYLDNVDRVAFEQDDIYDLLDDGETTIYLCGEKFNIPLSKKGITYIGVNNPIIVVDSTTIVDWKDKEITLKNTRFDECYAKINNVNDRKAEEDFDLGIEECLKLLSEDPNSILVNNRLGQIYDEGIGVEKDFKLSMKYSLVAANKGNSTSQKRMGDFYFSGKGVKQDYSMALEWYNKALKDPNVDPNVLFSIGYCYELRDKDYQTSMEWYLKAAQLNEREAQYSIGLFYEEGYGVAVNNNTAIEWYRKAADQGFALSSLGKILLKTNRSVEGFEWLCKAAEKNESDAFGELSKCYLNGIGTSKNSDLAFKWALKYSEYNYDDAKDIVEKVLALKSDESIIHVTRDRVIMQRSYMEHYTYSVVDFIVVYGVNDRRLVYTNKSEWSSLNYPTHSWINYSYNTIVLIKYTRDYDYIIMIHDDKGHEVDKLVHNDLNQYYDVAIDNGVVEITGNNYDKIIEI